MVEPLRVVLAVVLLVAGVGVVGYAGYLQYASLPEEHTFARGSARAALALAGVALIILGSRLFP
jgi:uncharacterized membrane protein YphA (DoxX/SURF4 family)